MVANAKTRINKHTMSKPLREYIKLLEDDQTYNDIKLEDIGQPVILKAHPDQGEYILIGVNYSSSGLRATLLDRSNGAQQIHGLDDIQVKK